MSRQTQETMLKQLKDPFDAKFVKWRVGATNADKTKGIAVPYIDAREVTKRLDEVCGLAGWQSSLKPIDKGFICEITLLIDGELVTKSNAGEYTQISAIKGGASDAFKRAATVWGVGRYLYYLPQVWVPIKPLGKSYVLAELPELPSWAIPNKNIERWEDVAEMEAAANSGEEFSPEEVIENVDLIRDAKSLKELDTVVAQFNSAQTLILVNEIEMKRRELSHAAEVEAVNS